MLAVNHWYQTYPRNLRISYYAMMGLLWAIIIAIALSFVIKAARIRQREMAAQLYTSLAQPETLTVKLRDAADPVSSYLAGQVSSNTRQMVTNFKDGDVASAALKNALVAEINNRVKNDQKLYEKERASALKLREGYEEDYGKQPKGLALAKLNHELLEAAYPKILTPEPEGVIAAGKAISYADLAPPPSLSTQAVQAADMPEPAAPQFQEMASTVPQPVPDEMAEATTMQTQRFVGGPALPQPTGPSGPATLIDTTNLKIETFDDNKPAPVTFKYMKASVMPQPLKDAALEYPEKARTLNLEGTSIIDMWLRKDGTVSTVQIYKSSGHAILDTAAARAALKSTFTPAKGADGSPVNVWVRRPFTFSLTGGR